MVTHTTLALLLFFAQMAAVVLSQDKDGSWTCEKDGFWYQNGVKSKYSGCDDKDSNQKICTRSEDSSMPKAYPRTCVNGPPDNGLRCWWTYVPASLKGSAAGKVPLVVDMHGGGGCASHEAQGSGFKELSDTLGKDGFIVAWPQAYNLQWGTCGSDCAKMQKEENAKGNTKELQSTDDLTFLAKMVAYMVKAEGLVDAERVYVTGFSMGCMMCHRMALEKSQLVAGFGCHGGTLNALASDITDNKPERFKLLPMPVYMTGGTNDGWFQMASLVDDAWAAWNGCSSSTTTNVNLVGKSNVNSPKTAVMTVRSSCSASSVQVVTLNLTSGTHVTDQRMAQYTWDFLKKYKRVGALAALPALGSSGSAATGLSTSTKVSAALKHVPREWSAVVPLMLALATTATVSAIS